MELVYDRLDESSLVMDGQDGIGGYIDPVFCSTVSESVPELQVAGEFRLTSFKCQRLTRDEHHIGPLVASLHLIILVVIMLPRLPLGARGIVQTSRFVRGAVDVSRANDAVAV